MPRLRFAPFRPLRPLPPVGSLLSAAALAERGLASAAETVKIGFVELLRFRLEAALHFSSG